MDRTGGSESQVLFSVRWPGGSRTGVVGTHFSLGPSQHATVWVPPEVLEQMGVEGRLVDVRVVEHGCELRLSIGGRDTDSEWSIGETTFAVSRLPQNLLDAGDGALLGTSVAMRRLRHDIRLAASSDAFILIHGETGTGKELIARALHEQSPRREKPYVVIDCTAVADTLFESELFGHTKGAFSGASSHRVGPFEEADGGTIFIDEIGEIPLSMQPKLLRVLESGTVRRVGENTHRSVDVRVIAATHRDLKQMVREGTFRGDLYHRLAVLELESPPLRERHGDLGLLLRGLVGEERFDELTEAQWEAIETYDWSGNIRELRNFARRASVHGWSFGLFQAATDSSPETRPPASSATPASAEESAPYENETLADYRARQLATCEHRYLSSVLKRTGGNVTSAAQLAGLNRSHFHRVLRQHGIAAESVRRART